MIGPSYNSTPSVGTRLTALSPVTVVTPTLRIDAFLAEACRSVDAQQTEQPIEHIIVVDDISISLPPDETVGNRSRRFMHNHYEKGPGGARNTALDVANGAVVFFMDADDLWLENHVARVTCVYEMHPDMDCVSIAGLSFGQPLSQPKLTIPYLRQGPIDRAAVAWNPVGCPTGFSYRITPKTVDIRFKNTIYFQDLLFYLDLLRRGATFWRETSLHYWYRRSGGQLTSIVPVEIICASRKVIQDHIELWKGAGLSHLEAAIAAVQINRLTANRLRKRDYPNTILLSALSPQWAFAQVARQRENRRIAGMVQTSILTLPPY